MDKRILMFGTILVLLTLVLITPLFLNKESSPGAIPRLDIDHSEGETRIYVHGAVETSRYAYVKTHIRDLGGTNWDVTYLQNNTIGTLTVIPDTRTKYFELNITLMKGEDILVYNCIVEIGKDEDGENISIYLPGREEPIIARESAFPYRDVITEEAGL